MITWNEFLPFASAAIVLWLTGAVAALRKTKGRSSIGVWATAAGLVVYAVFEVIAVSMLTELLLSGVLLQALRQFGDAFALFSVAGVFGSFCGISTFSHELIRVHNSIAIYIICGAFIFIVTLQTYYLIAKLSVSN